MGIMVSAAQAATLVGKHERVVRRRLERGDFPGAHKGARGVWRIPVEDLAAIDGWTLDREALAALELRDRRTPTGLLARVETLEAQLRIEQDARRALERRIAGLERLMLQATGAASMEPIYRASEARDVDGAIPTPVEASIGAGDLVGAPQRHSIGLSPDARHILSEPTPRRAVPTMRLSSNLPDDLVSWRAFAKLHGIPTTTVEKAMDGGRLPAVSGKWKDGSALLLRALDADGRRVFVALWGDRDSFRRCPECPHV